MTTVTVYVNGLPEEFPAHYEIGNSKISWPGAVEIAPLSFLIPDDDERWRFERDFTGKWYGFQTQYSRSSIPHSYRGEGINDIG